MREYDKVDKTFGVTVVKLLELAQRADELFKSSKPVQKRQLVNLVLTNLHLKQGKVLYEVKKPFSTILDVQKTNQWGQLRDDLLNLKLELNVSLGSLKMLLNLNY